MSEVVLQEQILSFFASILINFLKAYDTNYLFCILESLWIFFYNLNLCHLLEEKNKTKKKKKGEKKAAVCPRIFQQFRNKCFGETKIIYSRTFFPLFRRSGEKSYFSICDGDRKKNHTFFSIIFACIFKGLRDLD